MSSELDSDFQVKGRRRHAPECRKFQNPLFTDSCPINLSYFWDPLGAVMTSAPPAVLQRKSVNIPTHFILLSFWKWESKGLLCFWNHPDRQTDSQHHSRPTRGQGKLRISIRGVFSVQNFSASFLLPTRW